MKKNLTDAEYAVETAKHEDVLANAINTIKSSEDPKIVREQLLAMHASIHGIAQARLALIEEHTHPRQPLQLTLTNTKN